MASIRELRNELKELKKKERDRNTRMRLEKDIRREKFSQTGFGRGLRKTKSFLKSQAERIDKNRRRMARLNRGFKRNKKRRGAFSAPSSRDIGNEFIDFGF